jgi:acetylornithine deacetylase
MLSRVLEHLDALVSFDTRNPPRAIGTDGIFDYLCEALPGFRIELNDHGAGAVSLLAVRGETSRVFNVHLDTVPSSAAWTANPLRLRVDKEKAIGLGACDIKGGAACLLTAAENTQGPAAFLFTTDEEANDARCIASFLSRNKKDYDFKEAIVAEPTMAQAVLAHRGIVSTRMLFKGQAGHASDMNALELSAVHQAMRWGVKALDHVESLKHLRFGGLSGLRFNIGRVEGGIKANMIAPSAEVKFGFRPLPSQNLEQLHEAFRSFASINVLAEYEETFRGAPLPSGDIADAENHRLEARDLADSLGLQIGNAVDFWTEAALFSEAGFTSFVYGPGDIAQAHTADEWVAFEQLATVVSKYQHMMEIK